MKKETRRSQRVADLVRGELSNLLLLEAHDPAVKGVTVTAVEMSPDLQSARVYFSVLGGDAERAGAGVGIPTPRDRAEVRASLHARAPLRRRPVARARRPGRGAPGPGPAAERGVLTAPSALKRGTLFLLDKPAGLTS